MIGVTPHYPPSHLTLHGRYNVLLGPGGPLNTSAGLYRYAAQQHEQVTGGHALADSDYGAPGPQSDVNAQIPLPTR